MAVVAYCMRVIAEALILHVGMHKVRYNNCCNILTQKECVREKPETDSASHSISPEDTPG
jgi:hypothetical protein